MAQAPAQGPLTVLENHAAQYPTIASQAENIRTLYRNKLWHDIADPLVAYFKDRAFDMADDNKDLVTLYDAMVKALHDKMNPMKYALVTVSASRQFEDFEQAITFLEEAKLRLEDFDAKMLCRIAQAEKRLNLGQHHDCFDILNEAQEEIKKAADLNSKVFAYLSQIYAAYYRRKEDQENFYKASLQFLAYTPASDLTDEEKKQWSIQMGMAVLLGKNIFNTTELLDKEILSSLVDSDFQWLYDLLQTLGKGQISEFSAATQKHADHISRVPTIMKEMSYLEQKVRIITFLELVFNCSKDEREISFERITQECILQNDHVELLIMKAMSLDLVRGSIDEVEKTVNITWVMPRYLNQDHLRVLEGRLGEWQDKMDSIIQTVESGAQELLTQK